MIYLKQAVIVEGRYDKLKLSNIVDAVIVETGGFQIFKDKRKLEYIKELAARTGIVILTDGDAAGFQIRAKLSSCIPNDQIYHAYIPDIYGKERRKVSSSGEGKLGVEGMSKAVILEALERSGVTAADKPEDREQLDGQDLFELGLLGQGRSRLIRAEIRHRLRLPERMNMKAFLKALNSMYGREEAYKILEAMRDEIMADNKSKQP